MLLAAGAALTVSDGALIPARWRALPRQNVGRRGRFKREGRLDAFKSTDQSSSPTLNHGVVLPLDGRHTPNDHRIKDELASVMKSGATMVVSVQRYVVLQRIEAFRFPHPHEFLLVRFACPIAYTAIRYKRTTGAGSFDNFLYLHLLTLVIVGLFVPVLSAYIVGLKVSQPSHDA
jgi:hypothetical protein